MIGLLFLVLVYKVVKRSKDEKSLAHKLKLKLEKKLVYSSFLRYMIVSNLKLTFTLWAFLISTWNFESIKNGFQSSIYVSMILLLCIWPLFVVMFMLRNYDKLHETKFSQRWDTLYQGIHLYKRPSLLYNAIFSVRRFDIVFINMFFSPGFPLSNFESH